MLSKAMDRDHPVAAVLMETTHMMFKSDLSIVRAAEAVASVGSVEEVLGMLRRLSAMDFGRMLLEMPNPGFPALSKVLPRMAKTEVQTAWTGNSGYEMFRQIKDFVLRLELYFEAICRRTMRDATILDFGCGWGRLARMMAYYTNPDSIWCLDPLRESVNICKEDGILGHVLLSDYHPTELPVGTARFDLAYAYSVFTHTSLRATTMALNTVRSYMKPDGLFVITVRCLVPGFDGAIFSREWKEALWARFCTAAPQRQRRSVERYSIVKRA